MGLCQISESNSGTATSLELNLDLEAQNAAKHGIDSCDFLTLRFPASGQHMENGTLFPSPFTPFDFRANKAQLWPNLKNWFWFVTKYDLINKYIWRRNYFITE